MIETVFVLGLSGAYAGFKGWQMYRNWTRSSDYLNQKHEALINTAQTAVEHHDNVLNGLGTMVAHHSTQRDKATKLVDRLTQ